MTMRPALLRTTMLAALLLPSAAPAGPSAQTAPSVAGPAKGCVASPRWAATPRAPGQVPRLGTRVANWIGVAPDGALQWNGSPISRERAVQFLRLTTMMTPRPITVLNRRPGTGCAVFAEAAAFLERHISCNPDLCRLAAGVERPPPPPPAPPPPPRRP